MNTHISRQKTDTLLISVTKIINIIMIIHPESHIVTRTRPLSIIFSEIVCCLCKATAIQGTFSLDIKQL